MTDTTALPPPPPPPPPSPAAAAASAGRRGGTLARLFRPLVEARTWKATLQAALDLPFGIAWFTILVTGLSVSVGPLITLIGIPILLLLLAVQPGDQRRRAGPGPVAARHRRPVPVPIPLRGPVGCGRESRRSSTDPAALEGARLRPVVVPVRHRRVHAHGRAVVGRPGRRHVPAVRLGSSLGRRRAQPRRDGTSRQQPGHRRRSGSIVLFVTPSCDARAWRPSTGARPRPCSARAGRCNCSNGSRS